MGKARGPKRKEAPARKRLQAGNSGLLHKQTHRNQNGGVHRSAGLDGGALMGKRTLSQQLLAPNKRSRGGKRRRKGDGPPAKGSSETAVIQAEYAAVDAREKAKLDADEAQRTRAPVRVRLAPPTASLRMPSQGAESMASIRASSSARMVEALLQSISDDPAPDAPPARPVRSAGRKRKGNPFAALGGDSDSDPEDSNEPAWRGNDGLTAAGGGGSSKPFGSSAAAGLSFASPSDFLGFSHGAGGSGSGGGSISGVRGGAGSVGRSSGAGAGMAPRHEAGGVESGDDDPDL